MSFKLFPRLFLFTLIVGLALIGPVPARSSGEPPTPTPPFGVILPPSTPGGILTLSNSDFEAGLAGWQTWHEDTGKPARANTLDYVIEPAFSIERNPALIKIGSASLHVGRIYDPWHAGLKRAIVVAPKSKVRFCIYGRLYASNRDFGHEASWASLDGRMQVGVLVGDGDWTTSGIVWSAPANPHDDWREMCVETTTDETGRVTLFTSANYRGQAAKHLDAWWDAASLSAVGGQSANTSLTNWPLITSTLPISVLLLIPSASITAYTVLPAQMFMTGQGITLALSTGAALSASAPAIALEATPITSVSPTPTPTLAPTFKPTHPTATFTPTSVPPTGTPVTESRPVVAATNQPVTQPAEEFRKTEPPANPVSLLGLLSLLAAGAAGGLYVIRQR